MRPDAQPPLNAKVPPIGRTFVTLETAWIYGPGTLAMLELIVLNVLPMIGPRIIRAAITTMATKTRINAYSTKP